MCLERALGLRGNARVHPFVAIKRVNAGPAHIEPAVVAAHGVGKTSLRTALGKNFGLPPAIFALLNEDGPRLRTAADIQFALEGGGAIQCAVVTGLAAVPPCRSAVITINSSGFVRAGLHTSPVVGGRHREQVALMDDQRPDAGRSTAPDLSAVGPAIVSVVAIDVAPVALIFCVDCGRVQLPLEDGERIADVIAGEAGAAAILPVAGPRVIDPKTDVPIGPLRLITTGAGLERQRQSSPQIRIVLVEHIAEDVADLSCGVDSGTETEVAGAEIERNVGGNLDIRPGAVERSFLQPDAMIDAVVAATGMIAAIPAKPPMAKETGFQLTLA